MPDLVTIDPGGPLTGRVRVPGDKSISHRALLFGALAEGISTIEGLSTGDDVVRTAEAMRSMGAELQPRGDILEITGGRSRLHEALAPVDVGNSGTGIRLLVGWAATFDWLTVLHGDESIAARPMDRIAQPLRLMGARVDGRQRGQYPPLAVRGGDLHGIEYRLPVPSAQVKSAVLIAGLAAEGTTTVIEGPEPTRAHTEEMLRDFGVPVVVEDGGSVIRVTRSSLVPTAVRVPGDPSQASFWIVAACTVPGSDIVVENVYVGRARAGFLDVLRRMGADVEVSPTGDTTADIRARYSELKSTVVEGAEVAGLIDEIPVLAVAAAAADGVTEFRDAAELTVKETNRVTTTVAALGGLGVAAEPRPDGLAVRGGGARHGGDIDSAGDHRIAMAAAIGALSADGPTRVRRWQAVGTSYPSFLTDLARLRP